MTRRELLSAAARIVPTWPGNLYVLRLEKRAGLLFLVRAKGPFVESLAQGNSPASLLAELKKRQARLRTVAT